MKFIISAVMLGLLSLLAFPAMATYPLASDIAGKVVDADKQPIVGARVIITHLETGRVVIKRTNEKGRYLALNLRSDGLYRVRVESSHGFVEFKPEALLLGHRMRRNAVIAPVGASDQWGWQWNMRGMIVDHQFNDPSCAHGDMQMSDGSHALSTDLPQNRC